MTIDDDDQPQNGGGQAQDNGDSGGESGAGGAGGGGDQGNGSDGQGSGANGQGSGAGDLPSDIVPVDIETEIQNSYLDYAMSVIVSRALPDVRDGLKPVHRRLLYAMHEGGYDWNKPYRKSSRIIGEVMGKYHPHGDQAIYGALVRMAQEFSLRLPLVDGQGNFGSIDGDSPAAMRYTEVRRAKATHAMLEDIDKNTVDFQDNYDNSESEPLVLPARFPNLLVNGASGIAVGMATNIPPHNLGEVIDGCLALLDAPDLTSEDLGQYVLGPDFPTSGIIIGRTGIRDAQMTGRGSVLVRGRVEIEEIRKDREAIIVTELPYQVNKAVLVEKIADLVREKRVEGISDLRDESNRDGIRVVIELKRDAVADVVINQLYRFTALQSSFGCNMVALNGGRPELLNLRDLVKAFVEFREVVVTRRIKHLLGKARDRAHVLVGLVIAVANIDEVIALIRSAPDPATARAQLLERDWPARDIEPLMRLIDDPRHSVSAAGTCRLSETQARAILELRLQRLTALGRDEIGDELKSLGEQITDYLDILRSRERVVSIIRQELTDFKDEFATPRLTEIIEGEFGVEDEDLIQREDMVVTVSHKGYIKRVPLSTYRAQRRGGKGRSGMSTRDEDFVTRLFVANTHVPMLFFSSRGLVYKFKVWRLPLAAPQARGKALINLLPLQQGETITTIMPLPEDEATWADYDVMFATTRGTVRRNKLSDFVQINRNGKIAMKLDEGDAILGVQICTENDDVLLTCANGQCIRFPVPEVRVFKGRDSIGVRGIDREADVAVISMAILRHFVSDNDERTLYLKQSGAIRRAATGEEPDETGDAGDAGDTGDASDAGDAGDADAGDVGGVDSLTDFSSERYVVMGAGEQFVLTISENGFGKRTSSYEFRTTRRGGKGIRAMTVNDRNGALVASFPVEDGDQIMLVTDAGQLIRCPVFDVRIAGRSTQGVKVFTTAAAEHVVSVEHIGEVEEDEDEDDTDSNDDTGGIDDTDDTGGIDDTGEAPGED